MEFVSVLHNHTMFPNLRLCNHQECRRESNNVEHYMPFADLVGIMVSVSMEGGNCFDSFPARDHYL